VNCGGELWPIYRLTCDTTVDTDHDPPSPYLSSVYGEVTISLGQQAGGLWGGGGDAKRCGRLLYSCLSLVFLLVYPLFMAVVCQTLNKSEFILFCVDC